MTLTSYKDRVMYNTQYVTYGKGYDLCLKNVRRFNLLLSFVIVGAYPIICSLFINKYLLYDRKLRYNFKGCD